MEQQLETMIGLLREISCKLDRLPLNTLDVHTFNKCLQRWNAGMADLDKAVIASAARVFPSPESQASTA